jgi:hypothetical protein
MGLIGTGEGNSLLIVTDAESRLLRKVLEAALEGCGTGGLLDGSEERALAAFNAGIARGTAKLQQEFKDAQARKKGKT